AVVCIGAVARAAGIGVCEEQIRSVGADWNCRCRATDARESILPGEIAHESVGGREGVGEGTGGIVVQEGNERAAAESGAEADTFESGGHDRQGIRAAASHGIKSGTATARYVRSKIGLRQVELV